MLYSHFNKGGTKKVVFFKKGVLNNKEGKAQLRHEKIGGSRMIYNNPQNNAILAKLGYKPLLEEDDLLKKVLDQRPGEV